MRRIILDTDVASMSLKGKVPPTLTAKLIGAQLGITFVTLGELTKWAIMRNWGPQNHERLARWLVGKPTLPYGDAVAHKWGEISAYAERRGRKRPQNDSWIAACCLVYGLPLATENVKDYSDFVEYEGLTLITH